jgi:hypothetical protein
MQQKNTFHSLHKYGIRPHEMFAWMNTMDVNSNLLRLKLDMVYRGLPLDQAETAFKAITMPDLPDVVPTEIKQGPVIKKKKKVVKAIVPKSK